MSSAEAPIIDLAELTAPWRDFAACRGLSWETFFPSRGDSTAEAKAICAGCAVREPCLDYALRTIIREGVWGATSERQRRRERHQRMRERVGLPRLPDRVVDPVAIAEVRIGVTIAAQYRSSALWPQRRASRRATFIAAQSA